MSRLRVIAGRPIVDLDAELHGTAGNEESEEFLHTAGIVFLALLALAGVAAVAILLFALEV